MNTVFTLVCTLSICIMLFKSPNTILPSMLSGGEKAINLVIAILPSYALWMGFFALLEKSGVSNKFAKIFKKPVKWLLGDVDSKTNQLVSLNISANLMGMSGVATPLGIEATNRLDKQNNFKALSTLFVLASSGLQLLPSSVISIRTRFLSASPSDIILPIFLSSLISAVVGIVLVKTFIKK